MKRLLNPLPALFALAVTVTPASFPAVASPAPGENATSDRFEQSYELKGIEKIRVQNVNGPVRISTWDKDTLHLTAVKKARGTATEETLRATEIRVTKTGASIEIETILPKKKTVFWFWHNTQSAEVSYELQLPANMAIDIETVNGRISTEKRSGSVSLSTVNGSVRVDSQTGPLKVNTVNGSVEATFSGAMKQAELETVNGSVTVSCAKDSSIRYELQTVNGGIKSEFENLVVKGKWGPKEARGAINGGRERLAVETVNGEVRLLAMK